MYHKNIHYSSTRYGRLSRLMPQICVLAVLLSSSLQPKIQILIFFKEKRMRNIEKFLQICHHAFCRKLCRQFLQVDSILFAKH